jgi:hypothetical protein
MLRPKLLEIVEAVVCSEGLRVWVTPLCWCLCLRLPQVCTGCLCTAEQLTQLEQSARYCQVLGVWYYVKTLSRLITTRHTHIGGQQLSTLKAWLERAL